MTPELDLDAVEQWLYTLHGGCPGYSVVSSPLSWTGRAVETHSETFPDDLLRYVRILDNQGTKGIYLRVTTVGTPPPPGRRGSDEHSVALPALWLDMDIAGPGHKPIKPTRENPDPLPLPPDDFACAEILSHTDLPEPTLWVHSGGGMYPYWFFKHPVALTSPEKIEQWSKWSATIHDKVHEAAKELGFHYGLGTHDMSRVLRIPGTVNRKVDGAHKLAQQVWAELGGHTFLPEELQFAAPAKPVMAEKIAVSSPPSSASSSSASSSSSSSSSGALRPGDDYNQRGDVLGDVLVPQGWQIHSRRGAELFLTRPGKDRRDGHSASLGYDNSPNLYVWSTDAGLPVQQPLSPFYLFAHYNHGGDFKAAAVELGRWGFGDELPTPTFQADGFTQQNANMAAMGVSPQTAAPAEPAGSREQSTSTVSEEQQESTSPPPPSSQGLRAIDMTDERMAILEIVDLIGAGNTECMFRHNGRMVYVPACDEHPSFAKLKKVTKEGIIELDAPSFRGLMGSRLAFYRRDKEGTPKATNFNVNTASAVFSNLRKGLGSNLRPLRDVVRRPIVRPDGTICDTPGYDETTQVVYWPDPTLQIPAVPEDPTAEQITLARDTLAFMLTDFPFVSREDYNNYLGFLLTPLLFSVIDTPIKLGVIGAHQPGSGKTLLANILQEVHGGTLMPGLKSSSDDETRKQVTANLRNVFNPVCLWDNVSGRLDSPTLDALLTSRTWRDRVLGQTQMVDMANDRLWLITGNNLQVGSDLTRRVTWSMINPNMPDPERRTNFAIPDMMGWVKSNKGVILWALYTLIQAWTRQGQPTWCAQSDLFCGWVGAINGILATGGIGGEFDSRASRQQGESAQSSEWGELFEAAFSQFGEEGWTISGLLDRVGTGIPGSVTAIGKPLSTDILPLDVLNEFRAGNTTWVARTLGIRMASVVNSFCGGYQLIKMDKRTNKGIIWAVRPIRQTVPADTPPEPAAPVMPQDLARWPRRLDAVRVRAAGDPLARMAAQLQSHALAQAARHAQPDDAAQQRSSGPSSPAVPDQYPLAGAGPRSAAEGPASPRSSWPSQDQAPGSSPGYANEASDHDPRE